MNTHDYWLTDREMDRDEQKAAQSKRDVFNCGDRTCGADDCRACYPGTRGTPRKGVRR